MFLFDICFQNLFLMFPKPKNDKTVPTHLNLTLKPIFKRQIITCFLKCY